MCLGCNVLQDALLSFPDLVLHSPIADLSLDFSVCTEGAHQLSRAASLPSLLLPQPTACVSGQQVRTLEVLLFRILLFRLILC